jgi:hypothetical protein
VTPKLVQKTKGIDPKAGSIFPSWKTQRKEITESRNTAEAVNAGAIKTPGCFLENTSVTLANGSLIDIENINVGDEVYLISPNNRLDNTVIFFNKADL